MGTYLNGANCDIYIGKGAGNMRLNDIWGTLIFKIILFTSFFNKNQKVKKYISPFGELFHLGIVFLFEQISFFFAMFRTLILFIFCERNLNEFFM